MGREIKVMLLNLPSPPHSDVCRDWAGGFGIATPAKRREEYGHSSDPFFYPFLAYASAVLNRQNCDYTVLDGQKLKLNEPQILNAVKKRNPDVTLSLLGLPSLRADLALLDAIKEAVPNAKTVCVGTSCKVLKQEIFDKAKVDVISTSAYPYVSNLALLVEALRQKQDLSRVPYLSYVKDGKVFSSAEVSPQGLDSLFPPRYDELDSDGYECFRDYHGNRYRYISILGSTGCSNACFYCPYPLGFGTRWSGRSPDDIVTEIEYLSSRGVKGLMFRDQSFPSSESHAMKICDLIIERKLDVAWSCEARVDHLSRRVLEVMKKAGCRTIQLGVETGDERLIGEAKPRVNLNIVRRAFRLIKEYHLCSMAHIIFGWPEESAESMEKTGRFVAELAPDRVNWNFLTPYPGTKLQEIAKSRNLILTYDWSKYTSHTVVMRSKWLSGSQIWRKGNEIMRKHRRNELVKLPLSIYKRPRLVLEEIMASLSSVLP